MPTYNITINKKEAIAASFFVLVIQLEKPPIFDVISNKSPDFHS